MIVAIARQVAETLMAEAAAAHPRECCGLLLGVPGQIERAVVAANVAADPLRRFEIDPATLLRTHREARGAGLAVVGHYHSHPDGIAAPSPRDAARAVADGQIWLIVAGDQVTGWRMAGDGRDARFAAVELELR